MALRFARILPTFRSICSTSVRSMAGWGDGAGKGGGSGGSIRDSGGAFGKMEAAHEEQYFRKLQAEQLKKMRESLHDEIDFHKEQIEEHEEAIERHKKKIKDFKHMED